jgi:hypothetical protein
MKRLQELNNMVKEDKVIAKEARSRVVTNVREAFDIIHNEIKEVKEATSIISRKEAIVQVKTKFEVSKEWDADIKKLFNSVSISLYEGLFINKDIVTVSQFNRIVSYYNKSTKNKEQVGYIKGLNNVVNKKRINNLLNEECIKDFLKEVSEYIEANK